MGDGEYTTIYFDDPYEGKSLAIVGAHDIGVGLTVAIIAKDDVEVTIPLAQAEELLHAISAAIATIKNRSESL
ncbi:MAG: hypothetical protein LAP38_29115 [Acidobacteriia bacterium]|nr:hypothetical protein [Terriglobia bacterium]